jgi:predicted nucleic acid-binding protein
MAYIDTSLLAAFYCPEPLSRTVQQRLSKLDKVVISPLVELELYSAVAAKVRARELTASSAGRVLDMFRKHLADGLYDLVPIEIPEYDMARDWIGRFTTPLRAPDALHLAAAFDHDLTLLTADKAMASAARHLGVSCELIA